MWLPRIVVDAVHDDLLREHGGLSGVRDEHGLESALARPLQKSHYEATIDIATLAAAYAFGLVKGRPYRDGNKRIGFLAMVTFLGINGHAFDASDADVVTQFLALADRSVTDSDLADWVREHVSRAR